MKRGRTMRLGRAVTGGSALAVAVTAGASGAAAGEFPARETAWLGAPGATSVGVFNPLTHVPRAGVELSTYPLFGLLVPNAAARFHLFSAVDEPVTLVLETGLSLPGGVFTVAPPFGLQGYLTPSCKVERTEPGRAPEDCDRPGTFLVPTVGLAASHGHETVVTARLDFAPGLLVDGERAPPRDTWAPLDLLFAPVFNQWRAHLGLRADHRLLGFLRLAGEAHVYRVAAGPPPVRSPWTLVGHVGTDWRTTPHTRLTLGASYWNSDQRRIVAIEDNDGYSRFEHVRSHDFGPTLDFIWSWGG